MKKIVLLAFASLVLGASACKVQTCPAYSKVAPPVTKPAPALAKRA